MKKILNILRNLLLILIVFVIGFYGVSAIAKPAVPVVLENCQPGTWVGMVKWINNKTDYENVPGAKIKQSGSITIMLEPGEYAITHFKPAYSVIKDGVKYWSRGTFLEFREVEITIPTIISFGCGE